VGGYLLWCSSHCFSHFPLACRNLRIDITTLDFTPALSEGDHYSMANAVAEVENGHFSIPSTARLNRVISALLVEGYKVEFDYYTTEEG